MKVLVFGQTGQVARALQKVGPVQGFEIEALSRSDADLRDGAACGDKIASSDADMVINAAAYTAVDAAEDDRETAFAINGNAPGHMARAAKTAGLPFVHISTDYVFDGSGSGAWAPEDSPNPQSVYGASKLAGEREIQAACGKFTILRTSWVFSPYGQNFVKTMLRLAETRDKLTVVADQVGGPTPAKDIANTCLALGSALVGGKTAMDHIYHLSGAPNVSWADFARAIFRQRGLDIEVENIPSSAYPTSAVRPSNSRLDCSSLLRDIGRGHADWHLALTQMLRESED